MITGMLLLLFSMAFKVSAAPFHFWTPDVYDGAPTVFTSFMATIVKVAGFIALLRLFDAAFGVMPEVAVDLLRRRRRRWGFVAGPHPLEQALERVHCGSSFAFFTTFAHFASSARMNAANSSGGTGRLK